MTFKKPSAPIAPPVYKPEPRHKAAQSRAPVVSAKPPAVQTKKIVAPPVYRPQPVPRVLQTKKSITAPAAKPVPGPQPQPRSAVAGPPKNHVVHQPPPQKKIAPTPASAPVHQAIQRRVTSGSRTGIIQAKYKVDDYVTVFEEGGLSRWYGQVTEQLHGGYKVRIGGGSKTDTVDVAEGYVHPHPTFAGRYETSRSGESIVTAGGRWTARRYTSIMGRVDPSVRGCNMELEFMPNGSVDASSIVLVQTVRAVRNGEPHFMNETVKARSVNGISIDQDRTSASPEYAANPATSGGEFGAAPLDARGGDHGATGKAAWIFDRPHLGAVYDWSFQVFETTAIAASGNDKGKYYGSVSWGWLWRGAGEQVELYPLEVVSSGSVSDHFINSARRWNVTDTSTNARPVQIPLPK